MGVLDVRIGDPRVDEHSKRDKKGEKRWITLTIPIVEGTLYKLGTVTFVGNELFTTDELRSLVPLQEGMVISFQR